MIEGKKVHLRVLEITDAESLKKLYSTDGARLYGRNLPESIERINETILIDQKFLKEGSTYRFGIIANETNKLVGIVALQNVDHVDKKADIPILVLAEERRKGYASEALKLILDFGFKELGLNSVSTKIVDENKESVELFKKMGFTESGKFRKNYYFAEEYHDFLIFDLLSKEWTEK